MGSNGLEIKNKKALFEYYIIREYVAGIKLEGSEIKSIRNREVNLNGSFCFFYNGELFVKNMNISDYKNSTHQKHDPLRDKKLLLTKKELSKIKAQLDSDGITLIPVKIFINDRGLAKLIIAIAKGKKLHDKREAIKEKDIKRRLKTGEF